MKPTKQEIIAAIDDLKEAMLDAVEFDIKVEKLSAERPKVHKKLSLARDAVHAIRFN